jgi:DNA-directed RNA polymerase
MSNLYTLQEELEYEAVVLGRMRYEEALRDGDLAESLPGRWQAREGMAALAKAIEQFVEEASAPVAGRKHSALPYLLHVLPEQAAYITINHALNGAQQRRRAGNVAVVIGSAIEDHINLTALGKNAPGLYRKVMDQLKNTQHARHRTGVLRHVVKKYPVGSLSWSDASKLSLGMKLIELFEQTCGVIELHRGVESRNNTPVRIQFTDEAEAWFKDAHERASTWRPVHLPMVCPPRRVYAPHHSPYLTRAIRARLVHEHVKGSMDDDSRRDMPAVYAAINTISATPWRVSKAVLGVVEQARAAGPRYERLFAEEDVPLPVRPAHIPLDVPVDKLPLEQREELAAWRREASLAHGENARRRSRRIGVGQKLWVAEKFKDFEAIYFPHYVDFRGRAYPYASYLNPQADDLGRALLEFAHGRPLGERGWLWLQVHLANLFGIDKVAFGDRLEWVEAHRDQLLACALAPLDTDLWQEADSPWCALAACMEYAGAILSGDPASYVSHLPIAMDGSCSGLQHYSAMLRDPVGGAAVNLVPADKPADIYSEVARRAQAMVDASTDADAECWKGGKVVRKIAKQPTMTLCYSATVFGMRDQIRHAVEGLGGRNYLGGAELRPACAYMAQTIWNAIGSTVVAAKDAMAFLKQLAALASQAELPIIWRAPSGFTVVQGYTEPVSRPIKVFYKGQRLELRITEDGTKIDRRKQAAGVAPNFVHSLDAAHLMATVNIGRAAGIEAWACIHDSFGVHAADVDDLHDYIRDAFVQQYSRDVLADLRSQIEEQLTATAPELVKELPPVPARGTLDLEAVRQSDYFFA